MVDEIRQMEKILGKPIKEVYPEEHNQYISMKRGIKSSTKLNKGTKLLRKHLRILRPCSGDDVPADKLKWIIGKKIKTNLEANRAIKKRMIEN